MAKIKRDAFLYLDPKPPASEFGQCSTCEMWTGRVARTCLIHGRIKIGGGDSCGLYVHGSPQPQMAGREVKAVTPSESGLVDRQVRCENCKAFVPESSKCALFVTLNKTNSQLFDLDERVDAKGCCNAQQPK